MGFIYKFKYLGEKSLNFEKYSLYLNEFRKNLAAPGKLLLRCSTTYVPVGDLDRSPLMHSYGYASADDQSTLFAIFPLTSFPSYNMRAKVAAAVFRAAVLGRLRLLALISL